MRIDDLKTRIATENVWLTLQANLRRKYSILISKEAGEKERIKDLGSAMLEQALGTGTQKMRGSLLSHNSPSSQLTKNAPI